MTSKKRNLRKTNPVLWWIFLVIGSVSVLQGIDFIVTVPTFKQFGIPHNTLGFVFLAVGVSQLVALLLIQRLMITRAVYWAGVAWYLFWGVGTTTSAFAGESSFQLFVMYWGFVGVELPVLLMPYFDPTMGEPDLD